MRHAAATAIWLAASILVQAEPPQSKASACRHAIRDYQVAEVDDLAEAARRLRLACYAGPGRAPVLREPLAVGGGRSTATPALAAPVLPAIKLPSAPTVLTSCDGGGCWDNLGNRYNGTGAILHGPAGNPCIRNGDRIECR